MLYCLVAIQQQDSTIYEHILELELLNFIWIFVFQRHNNVWIIATYHTTNCFLYCCMHRVTFYLRVTRIKKYPFNDFNVGLCVSGIQQSRSDKPMPVLASAGIGKFDDMFN